MEWGISCVKDALVSVQSGQQAASGERDEQGNERNLYCKLYVYLLQMAVEKFGVSQDYIVYRILEEPKKSIFGKIKREAQVEATYEPPVEKEEKPTAEAAVTEQPAKPETTPASIETETAPEQTEEQTVSSEDSGGVGIESEEVECILSVDELSPGLARARQLCHRYL